MTSVYIYYNGNDKYENYTIIETRKHLSFVVFCLFFGLNITNKKSQIKMHKTEIKETKTKT